MSDDIEKEKKKVELENLGRLVDRYAQSRSLGLAVPLAVVVIQAVLLVGLRELLLWKLAWWSIAIMFLSMALCVGAIWFTFRLVNKHEYSFYRKDGTIELAREKIPIWAWAAYAFTFIGPAVLNELEMLSVRWALAMALASLGIFILYVANKHKETALGLVWGLLCLIGAAATAAGVPAPFVGRHSYFASLMVYIIGAGLITMVVVHIYNRKVLRKIKETRPFGEQEPDKSDT